MSHATLYINDIDISLLNDDKILYRQPSHVLNKNGEFLFGSTALAKTRIFPQNMQNRFWFDVSNKKYKIDGYNQFSPADIASKELEYILSFLSKGTPILIVVPPYLEKQQVSLIVGIANELNIKVIGIIESAIAATRNEYKDSKLLHLDLHLHCLSISLLQQDNGVILERSVIINDCGMESFYALWIKMISKAFIKQCRFDPLHTGDSDQQLFDNLPVILSQSLTTDIVHIAIKNKGQVYSIEIVASEFSKAVIPLYKLLLNKLRLICEAEDLLAFQFSSHLSKLPGLKEFLESNFSSEIFKLPEETTIRGASERFLIKDYEGNSLKLHKKLPWDKPSIRIKESSNKSVMKDIPSHILYESRAYKISELPLNIGTNPPYDNHNIKIKTNIGGISRQHCSLIIKNNKCLISDLSRYGTYLNDQRIENSTFLSIGDKIRIGSPGIEFLLIYINEDLDA